MRIAEHNMAMSYGVLASKAGQILVETTSGSGGVDSDVALDRFQTVWGAMWVPGRLTLTKLHLNFIPNQAGRGMAMMDLNLRDISSVELSGGRMSKQIGLRTDRHIARIRLLGTPALSAQIAELAEAARKTPRKMIR